MTGKRSSTTTMAREKIKIRKIDNITARQVTFSKRRRGIFKKAEELAVLCDADLALIIFSATGKLFDYSSTTRMKDILTRYNRHSKDEKRPEQPVLELKLESSNLARLSKEAADKSQELRKLRGEELHGLDFEELHQLEKMLEGSLSRVADIKGKRITYEIETLEEKGERLMEENACLKHRLFMISQGRKLVNYVEQSETITANNEEGQSSESLTNGAPPLTDQDDSSDTSLKLGLCLY